MRAQILSALLFASAQLASSPVAADYERGRWYGAITTGDMRASFKDSGSATTLPGFAQTSATESKADSLFTIGAGYKFSNALAGEASFVDADSFHGETRSFSAGSPTRQAVIQRLWTGSGLNLAVVSTRAVHPRIAVHARASGYILETETTETVRVLTLDSSGRVIAAAEQKTERTKTVFVPALRLGASATVHQALSIGVAYEAWLGKVKFGNGDESSRVRVLSLTATVHF